MALPENVAAVLTQFGLDPAVFESPMSAILFFAGLIIMFFIFYVPLRRNRHFARHAKAIAAICAVAIMPLRVYSWFIILGLTSLIIAGIVLLILTIISYFRK